MSILSPTYPAKLLLFGEHLLLLGASALAVPVPAFGGHWTQYRDVPVAASLRGFAENLVLTSRQDIDVERFKHEIGQGMCFDSNIPEGYGLGSSGAVCAAVYDGFAREKTASPPALKAIFARMEGYFHGQSSGIDPLTSYLRQTILIQNKTEVMPVEAAVWPEQPVVFLLDSRLPRQTGPLVQWFLEQSQQTIWRERLERELLPAHEAMVQGWLQAQADPFWPALRQVSRFQFEHFHPMVPATLRDTWRKGLDHPDLAFKICGAGGGGFLLGFARHAAAMASLSDIGPLVFPFEKA